MNKNIIAIVPSAGIGKRFSLSVKKTFTSLQGAPLIAHTLKRLCEEELITEVLPVISREDIEKCSLMIREFGLRKVNRIAPGGNERQDSVFNALKLIEQETAAKDSIILIHDGVRPFIPEGLIGRLIRELDTCDGVVPGLPLKETIKETDAQEMVISTVDRERFRSVQTPQAFRYSTIKKAYDSASSEAHYATDDAALVERAGGKVRVIAGSPFNIKITTPEDLDMIEFILSRSQDIT